MPGRAAVAALEDVGEREGALVAELEGGRLLEVEQAVALVANGEELGGGRAGVQGHGAKRQGVADLELGQGDGLAVLLGYLGGQLGLDALEPLGGVAVAPGREGRERPEHHQGYPTRETRSHRPHCASRHRTKEFEVAKNKKERMAVIGANISPTFMEVLKMGFNENLQWYFTEMPEGYNIKETPPGLSYARLSTELRKLYMFQKGNPTADQLTEKKREQLLAEFLDNLEPREAEVIMGIFNKDLGVKGLNAKFVKENFPSLFN